MICETCHGTGMRLPSSTGVGPLPCGECGGAGFDHCCDPKDYPDMACALRPADNGQPVLSATDDATP